MAATAIPIDTLPSINPATGEVLAHFERTPASQLPEIISRARIAQSVWAKLPIRNRCEKLRGLRDRIMASRKELADAVVRDSAKPDYSGGRGGKCGGVQDERLHAGMWRAHRKAIYRRRLSKRPRQNCSRRRGSRPSLDRRLAGQSYVHWQRGYRPA